jgi:protein phosphatase
MSNASSTIQCPNPACQERNSLNQQFCQRCQTFLPKRLLWAVGDLVDARPGDLLGDRYQLLHSQVVLDTQPGLLPGILTEIPPMLEAYLRLSPYKLHVPQIYGWLSVGQGRSAATLLLLEQAAIYPAEAIGPQPEKAIANTVMPNLISLWPSSPPLRQLNWIWQIAQLWQPLSREQATATLLKPDLLRVDGGCVRLLELAFDSEPPSLAQLGQFWQQALPATEAIAAFWQPLCQQLITEQISHSDQLLTLLDQGLADCGASQTRCWQIATCTDQGPTRSRNEDACYPPSGTVLTLHPGSAPVVIVCDGIGGHEGGNVASNLAITTIESQLSALPLPSTELAPPALFAALDQATFAANDMICQRNDAENRQERQRMGTTLVMGLINAHDLYINHVGDSRAYRITRTGCYQVTLDDDVASREVRLGYALYRDALQQPASGSLIQALGMNKSSFLHPTVQRFVLDEDCVFLLCSDGLSDYDRIEACWSTEIVPLLEGRIHIETVSRRLVEVANTRNGHDNVTVGLIYCQVTAGQVPSLAAMTPDPPVSPPVVVTSESAPTLVTIPQTQLLPPPARGAWGIPILLALLALAVVAGLLASWLLPPSPAPLDLSSSSPRPHPSSVAPPHGPILPSPVSPKLAVGALIQIERSANLPPLSESGTLRLLRRAGVASTARTVLGQITPGSILRVVKHQGISNQGDWLQLKVCTAVSGNAPGRLTAGAVGWQTATTIVAAAKADFTPTPEQIIACEAMPPAAIPTPEKR